MAYDQTLHPDSARSMAAAHIPAGGFALLEGLTLPDTEVPIRVTNRALQDLVGLAASTVEGARASDQGDVISAKLNDGKLDLTVRMIARFGEDLRAIGKRVDEAVRQHLQAVGLPLGKVLVEVVAIEAVPAQAP